MTLPTLYYLPGSPWNFKALWVLKHHLINVNVVQPTPVITEQYFRFFRHRQRVSFPFLQTASGFQWESYDIAQWAEARSVSGAPLLPQGFTEEIAAWDHTGDVMLAYGRLQLVKTIQQSDEIADSFLPPSMKFVAPVTRPLIRLIFGSIIGKYKDIHDQTSLDKVKKACHDVDAALKKGGGYLVGGRFTYADISMVAALGSISWLGQPWTRNVLPKEARAACFNHELIKQYPQLIAWRDGILQKHFPSKAPL